MDMLHESQTQHLMLDADIEAQQKSAHAFRTISEVSEDIDVPQHVLRFWESKFNQIKPLKRGGGRRYYRPEDVALLRQIKNYLYAQGYTIKGVQRLLKNTRRGGLAAISPAPRFVPYASPLASLPDFPFHDPQPAAVPLNAYLHAAAASPSAIALACGVSAAPVMEKFVDAFEEATTRITEPVEAPPITTLEQTLEHVTAIHDALRHTPVPARVVQELREPELPLEVNDREEVFRALLAAVQSLNSQNVPSEKQEPFIVVNDAAWQKKLVDPSSRKNSGGMNLDGDERKIRAPFPVPKATAVMTPSALALGSEKKQQLEDLLAELVALRGLLAQEARTV